jgi:hypothetical protein
MKNKFLPKSIVVLKEGYSLDQFSKDLIAGIIVGIVALPLSIALAIASGVSPERGLFTAIIGGFYIYIRRKSCSDWMTNRCFCSNNIRYNSAIWI